MITLSPHLPNSVMVLDKCESFGDYARQYGDAIAEHYEKNGLIYIPFVPFQYDATFFSGFSFKREWKKIGTDNGIDLPLIEKIGDAIGIWQKHPFLLEYKNLETALFLQSQIASFNAQLRQMLTLFFPRYYSLKQSNITWRLTETVKEGLHLDAYDEGRPITEYNKGLHRIKIFINIDARDRVWNISHPLDGALKACRAELPDTLPNDLNKVNYVVNKLPGLQQLPRHEVCYPFLSAILGNGETLTHEVIYGRRTVAAEFFCEKRDMLNPGLLSHTLLPTWLENAGIRVQ